MSSGIEHVHSCPQCKDDVLCRLDCDDMADGDNVCGPCAERNFDNIVPQEVMARKVSDGRN